MVSSSEGTAIFQTGGFQVTQISQIHQWRTTTDTSILYERLLASLGTEGFGANVHQAVQTLTAGARRLYLFEATGRDESSLHYFSGEPGLTELFPAYCRWYRRQDPVMDAYGAAPRCSDVVLQRVRPGHIVSPGFRRRIFEDAGIVERVSVIQRGQDGWRVMNVGRHASEGCCSDAEIDSLVSLACLVLPMLPLHRPGTQAQDPTIEEFEQRFAMRFGQLPERERQVCARAAAGLDVARTASDLGIAKSSVLTYRQRAYQRLRVSNALGLRALVTN